MTRKFALLFIFAVFSACTQPEEPVLMEEPIAGLNCDNGDGIGGTGCPAEASNGVVTRNWSSHDLISD